MVNKTSKKIRTRFHAGDSAVIPLTLYFVAVITLSSSPVIIIGGDTIFIIVYDNDKRIMQSITTPPWRRYHNHSIIIRGTTATTLEVKSSPPECDDATLRGGAILRQLHGMSTATGLLPKTLVWHSVAGRNLVHASRYRLHLHIHTRSALF